MRTPVGTPADQQLPKSWAAATLSTLGVELKSGFASGKHSRSASGLIPHLRPMNVDTNGWIDLGDVKYVASDAGQARLAPGDVLFNNTNSPALVGKTAFVGVTGEFAFSNHMTRVRVRDVSARFIALQLQLLQLSGFFQHLCVKHVNQASINTEVLARGVPIAIAPLAEQERIVAVIDEHLSRLDAGTGALTSANRRADHLQAAAMAHAVSGDWPLKPLSEVTEDQTYGSSAKSTADHDDGMPIVRMGNIQDGRVDLTAGVKFLSRDHPDASKFALRRVGMVSGQELHARC